MLEVGWAARSSGNAQSAPIARRTFADGLAGLLAAATEAQTKKADVGLTPGIPISSAPTKSHKINRSRDNMHDASILAVDVDGAPKDQWSKFEVLLAELGLEFAALDSFSHAQKSFEQPGLVWRHLFVRTVRPVNADEYAATWIELERLAIESGLTGIDRSKQQIENVIYCGWPGGVQGYAIHVEGDGFPVIQPPPAPVRPVVESRPEATNADRAIAYLAKIEDPIGEPDFCEKLCRLKKACDGESTFRALALQLAARGQSLKGNPLLDADHEDPTLDKIESVVRNGDILYASLPDRPRVDSDLFVWPKSSGSDPDRVRTPIPVHRHEVAAVMAVEQLLQLPYLFRRGDEVVRIVEHGEVKPVSRINAHGILMRELSFVSVGDEGSMKHANCSPRLSDLIWDQLTPELRPLDLVCRGPVLGIGASGYAETNVGGVLSLPWDPGTPTQDWQPGEALAAMIDTFGFATPEDRAMAIALLCTIVARPQIRGATPFFMVTGPSSGSGKTLLTSILFEIADGKPAAVIGPGITQEEREKRLTSTMQSAPRGIHFENMKTGSHVEDGLLTTLTSQAWYHARILGTSNVLHCRQSAVIVAEGNNLGIGGDLRRRTAPILLQPRRTWQRGNENTLRDFVEANRGAILADVERILATPGEYLDCPGYGDWARLVRGPVAAALGVDPWLSRGALEAIDEDQGNLEAVVSILELAGAKDSPMTSRQIIDIGSTDLRFALEDFLGVAIADAAIAARKLGNRLKRFRGRVLGTQTVTLVPQRGRASWSLVQEVDPEPEAPPSGERPGHGAQGDPATSVVESDHETPGPIASSRAPLLTSEPGERPVEHYPDPKPDASREDLPDDYGAGYTMPSPDDADALLSPLPVQPGWVIPPNVPKSLWERGGEGSLGIIDGNGSVCRGFYALPDVPMAGLTELRADVERLRAAQFERIVVIFDALDRTQDHRLALDSEYKANRRERPKPEGLRRQLAAARELCCAIRAQYDCDSSVEADDLIAWHVVKAMDVSSAVTILTLDKDLSMLVGEFGRTNVACWTAGGGVVDPSAVETKWGVPPSHLCALFSLMGDSSDGVKGVDGIGQTIGGKIVMAHGQLAEILAAARAGLVEPERIRKRLLEQEARAWLSRDLIALRPDLVGAPRVAIVGDVVTAGGDPKALYDWRWLNARGLT